MTGVVLWKKQRKTVLTKYLPVSEKISHKKLAFQFFFVSNVPFTTSLSSHVLPTYPSSQSCCIATIQIHRNWSLGACKYNLEILLELGDRAHFSPLDCVCFFYFLFQNLQLLFIDLLLMSSVFRPNVVRTTPIYELHLKWSFWEILHLFEWGMQLSRDIIVWFGNSDHFNGSNLFVSEFHCCALSLSGSSWLWTSTLALFICCYKYLPLSNVW
jgi:hypothetical protein